MRVGGMGSGRVGDGEIVHESIQPDIHLYTCIYMYINNVVMEDTLREIQKIKIFRDPIFQHTV